MEPIDEKSMGGSSTNPPALAALRRASARWNASRWAAEGTVGLRGRGPFAAVCLLGAGDLEALELEASALGVFGRAGVERWPV
jgi:hypothetical protein